MSNHNSKKAWRQWFEKAEFVNNLQTETLIPSQNTRDITIMGQGLYVAGIKLSFTAVVGGTATYVPANDVLDQFISNFRIKSQGKLTEQLASQGCVLAHLHKIYTGMYPVYTLNSASAPTLLTADVIVPVAMQAPFNITMLANLVINTATSLWASGATFTSANVQITVISTDVPPPVVFAFASQSLNLANTGNSNVTTMTEGFMRESYSLMGFANATLGQEQYVLPDGRGVIYQTSDQLRQQTQYKYPNITFGGMPNAVTGVVASVVSPTVNPLVGEELVECSYMSGGVALPWTNAGRLVLTTAAMVTTPTLIEILIAAPVKSQTKVGEAAQPTAMRPRTDLAAGGQTTPGTKPKVRY
jgi:hypothetical protein